MSAWAAGIWFVRARTSINLLGRDDLRSFFYFLSDAASCEFLCEPGKIEPGLSYGADTGVVEIFMFTVAAVQLRAP